MLPAIDMSDACATAVNRLLLQSPQSRSPEGESGFVQVRQGFGGFETVAVGVLRDPKSGLEWTATDNGRDINWADASAYCTKRGRGWRLPTADELLNLNDGSGVMQTRCGHDTCYVSSNFRLTSNSFWSGTRNGPSEAWIVLLFRRDFSRPVRDDNLRALCVRRP
ncbi:MAG: DUF1566 domain-containing protein [Rhodocyclaceae bacterium]|nr:DUF1566 domain-containing protein [Rhodocyclaceae bacterium]MCA3084436.1 DUF1566 domain-containing protein [Rhodocyclaceae bacterium]